MLGVDVMIAAEPDDASRHATRLGCGQSIRDSGPLCLRPVALAAVDRNDESRHAQSPPKLGRPLAPHRLENRLVAIPRKPGCDGVVRPNLEVAERALEALLRPVGMSRAEAGLDRRTRHADQ